MNIGYACLTVGVRNTSIKSCIQKNATPAALTSLIEHNLKSLEAMIDYNIQNDIHLFRISSDIIPFGSSPINTLEWNKQFEELLKLIGDKARESDIRLSMHPGQYTVLNSPNSDVVERAIADLEYHTKFLDALNLDSQHKIILHIGGVYGDKQAATQRFIQQYRQLSPSIKRRLVIENDDKLYTIQDVLSIGIQENIPVIFDNLHHQINHEPSGENEIYWINQCKNTWRKNDGTQKMHYSQQAAGKRPGSHSSTIYVQAFLEFYRTLNREDIDIMLEVKDKNLSAVKCIHCTNPYLKIQALEKEWSQYKYTVLERSPNIYSEIRQLLKNKQQCPTDAFYFLLERAMDQEPNQGNCINAAQHIWGYFKKTATEKEKSTFHKNMDLLEKGQCNSNRVKRQLQKLAEKYHQEYLLASYYFDL